MAAKGKNSDLIAENRRARFDYFLGDTEEAGIVLTGTEVKSLRNGKANIAESYVAVENGELMLINADIPPYEGGNRFNHEPRRPRKLLLHKRQIAKMAQAIQREGRTLVPTRLFWNDRGLAKLQVAVATGKKAHDKRETSAKRDWQRDKARIMKERG